MYEQDEQETLDIQELAAQMLGNSSEEYDEEDYDDEEDDDNEEESRQVGHPAWNEILSNIPEEYHDAIIPTLDKWDKGVSRRFQKIHDEYSHLKEFAEVDSKELNQAMGIYEALSTDPQAAWEAIGRVYGLSPQQVSQAASSSYEDDDDEDFDFNELPKAVRDRLLRLDQHERVLEGLSQDALNRQAAEQEADEDEALEEYLSGLHEEYGDFDEEYVLGLMVAGIDGDEAVERFQSITNSRTSSRPSYPRVMSSNGGIPVSGGVDVSKLSNQDTQSLITEVLRLSTGN